MIHLAKIQLQDHRIRPFSIIIASFLSKDSIDNIFRIFSFRFSILDEISIRNTKFRHDFSKSFVIKLKADKTFDYQGLEKEIYKAVSRVFSGLSAILDFEIINFREYDCSMDTTLPNCQVVELFLTVDTSRKLQNGVNIDISIDRLNFSSFLLE